MADNQYVPRSTPCDNRECGHPLSSHGDTEETTIAHLKSRVYPCLYFDKDNMTFAVCACRDFELPSLSPTEPDTPDEPVHNLTIEGDIVLVLWASGRVTWDPK